MEVTVHRTVTVYDDVGLRTQQTVAGEVLAVDRFAREHYYESFTVNIAGLEFRLGQSINGLAKKL